MHFYEVRQRRDKRGVDLISDALPFDRLWYGEAERDQALVLLLTGTLTEAQRTIRLCA